LASLEFVQVLRGFVHPTGMVSLLVHSYIGKMVGYSIFLSPYVRRHYAEIRCEEVVEFF
jgi:hypothetical protein